MPRLRLTRTQITEKAARDIKARTDARQAGLIREIAAERRLQYKRDQEQEQEDNQQARLTALIEEIAAERRLLHRRYEE